ALVVTSDRLGADSSLEISDLSDPNGWTGLSNKSASGTTVTVADWITDLAATQVSYSTAGTSLLRPVLYTQGPSTDYSNGNSFEVTFEWGQADSSFFGGSVTITLDQDYTDRDGLV